MGFVWLSSPPIGGKRRPHKKEQNKKKRKRGENKPTSSAFNAAFNSAFLDLQRLQPRISKPMPKQHITPGQGQVVWLLDSLARLLLPCGKRYTKYIGMRTAGMKRKRSRTSCSENVPQVVMDLHSLSQLRQLSKRRGKKNKKNASSSSFRRPFIV